jgi:hypothetical protein
LIDLQFGHAKQFQFTRKKLMPGILNSNVPQAMRTSVACRAQSDQVTFIVIAGAAAILSMMYLKVVHGAAELASPAVALEHPAA